MPRILSKNSHWLAAALCSCGAAAALSGCHAEAHASTSDDVENPTREADAEQPALKDDQERDGEKTPTAQESMHDGATKTPANEDQPTPAEFHRGGVALAGNLVFEAGKSTLREGPGSEDVLESLKRSLDQHPRVTLLRIEGNSDNKEAPTDSLKLSGDRALTIKQWLVKKGVAEGRLIAVGFGATKPIANNDSESGRAQNRRVEFKIAQTSGNNDLGADPLGGGTEFK
jgi:outer membrane protein OmpA-like peptidoglycan-associated protein